MKIVENILIVANVILCVYYVYIMCMRNEGFHDMIGQEPHNHYDGDIIDPPQNNGYVLGTVTQTTPYSVVPSRISVFGGMRGLMFEFIIDLEKRQTHDIFFEITLTVPNTSNIFVETRTLLSVTTYIANPIRLFIEHTVYDHYVIVINITFTRNDDGEVYSGKFSENIDVQDLEVFSYMNTWTGENWIGVYQIDIN